jgi:hypothetical protein
MFLKNIGEILMPRQSNAFLLVIVQITENIKCMIPTLIRFSQVEIYYFMNMQNKVEKRIVMVYGIFLMTMMKVSKRKNILNMLRLKLQVAWTLKVVRVHQEEMKELHKVEEKAKELYKAM